MWDDLTNLDKVIAANNVAIAFLSGLSAYAVLVIMRARNHIAFWRNPPTKDPLAWVLTGLLLTNIGWMFHRGFWAVWRKLRDLKYMTLSQEFEDVLSVFTVPAAFLVIAGLTLTVSPLLEWLFGRQWVWVAFWAILLVWLLSFHSVGVVDFFLCPGPPVWVGEFNGCE